MDKKFLQEIFANFKKNASNSGDAYYLKKLRGGCFCLMIAKNRYYVAFSGKNESSNREEEKQKVIKILFQKCNPTICYLTDSFLIQKEIDKQELVKNLPCMPINRCNYITYGMLKRTGKDLADKNFCAERKILGVILGDQVECFLQQYINFLILNAPLIDEAKLATILATGEELLNNLVFYSKFAPCNFCLPLVGKYEFYSIVFKGKFGGKPYKINFAESPCKYIYPTMI